MGIKSGLTEAFVIDAETHADILRRNPKAAENIKPFLNGRDVRRYGITHNDQYHLYLPRRGHRQVSGGGSALEAIS